MKLNESTEAILGNAGQTSKFKIAASAKAFKILSSGLYKNKIRAIVRELSCNVIDAHILNGSTEPFQIKAPTQLDPRFVIRDFGPGLDEDDITNLYSTYFASTKSNSNDFIGALGLGSKSPFSYTDTFTVVSYHGGKVRGFTAMLDGGEPALRKVFEEDMKDDEKTGIEITVPVKLPDITRWHSEIRYVLRTFKAHPHVIKGCSEPDYFPLPDDKGWFAQRTSYESGGLFAVYGKIVYPLNDVPGLKTPWMNLHHNTVFIHFDLGELDIAASREELSLDEDTVANIIKRVDSLSRIDMQSTIDELSTITNERELLRRLNKMPHNAMTIIQQSGAAIGKLSVNQLKEKYKVPDSLAEVGVVYDIDTQTKVKKIKGNGYSYGRGAGYSINHLFGIDNRSVNILIDDKSSKRVKVIRGLAHATPSILTGEIVVYKEDEPAQMKALATVKKLFGDDKVNILRVSECDHIIKNIPVSPNDPKETRPAANNVHTYTWNKTKGHYEVENFRMVSAELQELEGPVILRKRDDFYDFPSQEAITNFSEYDLNNLTQAFEFEQFHVVRSTVVERLIKYDMCTSLMDEIIEKLIQLVDAVDYDQYLGRPDYSHRTLDMIRRENKLNFLLNEFTVSGKRTPEAEKLNKLVSYINFNIGKNEDIKIIKNIINILREQANKDAGKLVKAFEEKYPAVFYIVNNCYNITDGIINDIKTIIDAKAKQTP